MCTFKLPLLIVWLLCVLTISVQAQGVEMISDEEYLNSPAPPLLPGAGTKDTSHVISKALFPPPLNQGKQESCVGFAVAYNMLTYYDAQKKNLDRLTEQDIYSPSYLYHALRKCPNCNCGCDIVAALNLLKNRGYGRRGTHYNEADCPNPKPTEADLGSPLTRIPDWTRLEDMRNLEEVKDKISANIPVLVVVKMSPSFKAFKNKSEGDVFSWTDLDSFEPHAMVITGYDDDKRAFYLLNSHGTEWGAGGYGWVSYESYIKMIWRAYILQQEYEPLIVGAVGIVAAISTKDFTPYVFSEQIRKERYHFTIGFNIDRRVVKQVHKIEYIYNHPTFVNKVATSYEAPHFITSYDGWGCLEEMEALIYLKDGKKILVPFDACEVLAGITPKVKPKLSTVKITPEVQGTPIGSENFRFVIELRGVEEIKTQIKKVVYNFDDPSFKLKDRVVTITDPSNNFQAGYDGYGCLDVVNIKIFFYTGVVEELNLNMCDQLGWTTDSN